MKYTTRPLSDRTWLRPNAKREWSRFDSGWRATITLLGKEIAQLDGRDVVIEVDVEERHLRLDGQLRADAKPASPAVVVAFESKHGPQLYRCDRFVSRWVSAQGPSWHQNLRAIGLTLQALRAVDRYGATETGQQYAGFKALNAGRAMPASHMTTEEAYDVLCAVLDLRAVANLDIEDSTLVRRARGAAHPDRHDGDRTLWDQVEQAAIVLGVQS